MTPSGGFFVVRNGQQINLTPENFCEVLGIVAVDGAEAAAALDRFRDVMRALAAPIDTASKQV